MCLAGSLFANLGDLSVKCVVELAYCIRKVSPESAFPHTLKAAMALKRMSYIIKHITDHKMDYKTHHVHHKTHHIHHKTHHIHHIHYIHHNTNHKTHHIRHKLRNITS